MRDEARRLGSLAGVSSFGALAALSIATVLAGRPVPAQAAVNTAAGSLQSTPRAMSGGWPAAAGTGMPGSASGAVQVVNTSAIPLAPTVAPLSKLRPADLLVVAPTSLRPRVAAAIRRLSGVTAVQQFDAANIKVNGTFVSMLGVDPSTFRAFAAGPTARSTSLWRSVAGGEIAVSYTMGKQDKLPLGHSVRVAGKQAEVLRVGGYGTVGIPGVDAVVSDAVARSLGIPAGNALVISAPRARLAALTARIKAALPRGAAIAQLVTQTEPGVVVRDQQAAAGAAGSPSAPSGHNTPMTLPQVRAFLKAAVSRVGLPYVWGAAGPQSFDCSGLVQWSMRQAGVVMPRVAVDQARTGPRVPLSQLRAGDLLFYHTDPTAPTYISHVAIYLGNDMMVQAPEPGMDVQVVTADFGSAFAGAVRVYPALAAGVAGNLAG